VHEVESAEGAEPKYIGDCPQYFPSGNQNAWHNFDGEFYYVDASGRPQRAYKYLPPVTAAPRNTTKGGGWLTGAHTQCRRQVEKVGFFRFVEMSGSCLSALWIEP
jgi:hypothetical protein